MAKNLNVNLAFTADTSQAKAQVQSLQNQLTSLLNSTSGSTIGSQITGDINQASKAIAELKVHLQNATNVNTGTLDFTKLNESINKSGMSLTAYGDKLRSLGPAGQQAFNSLASAVAQSEIPIRRSNAALTEMWTTLKNTARWQISSSILHGFMNSIHSAVGYAKDLNESLNNIRIVTGKSVDEMARFADQANNAAKALSTSTTNYTDAALIYYQQGLDDQQVQDRTDVTIKMANVTGQSAQIVSEQLTAVWNNFADGTQSLESFADKMVALGAATASSSDEIAGGLEKFAAIGDTIGLSFDYAASALATITANTRQSEEVVGTALKTIFARIQGLKMGETLEDGVELNKYSEALQAVGISIFDQAGELKNMDSILDEMGEKWNTLSKAQQVALAQTVAGVRQYTQLVALMDNWDNGDGDSFKDNLSTVNSATGSLDKQQETYEESWQAASQRVKAALQDVYDTLVNDEAFIVVLKHIEHFIDYIDNMIDSVGGLSGVLTTLGAILTKVFSAQISQGITNMANNLKMMTASGRKEIQDKKAAFIQGAIDATGDADDGTKEGSTRAAMMKDQLTLQQSMIENAERMSEEEKKVNQMLLDRQKILADNAIAAAQELDAASNEKKENTYQARVEMADIATMGGSPEEQKKVLKELNATYTELQTKMSQGIQARVDLQELQRFNDEAKESPEFLAKIKQAVDGIEDDDILELVASLDKTDISAEDAAYTIDQLITKLNNLQDETMVDMHNDTGVDIETIEQGAAAMEKEAVANNKVKDATKQADEARKNADDTIKNSKGNQATWSDTLVKNANSVLSLVSALQMLGGMADVLSNPDISGWDKFLSITSTLLMAIPMLITGLTGMKSVLAGLKAITDKDTIAKGLNAAATWLQAKAENNLQKEKGESKVATAADTKETNKNTGSKIANAAADTAGKKGGGTGGKVASGAGGGAGGTSLKGAAGNFGKSLGSLAKSYGAVAAGIAIIVGTIALAIYQYNKAANEAKSAAEAANEAAQAYGQASDAYNEFMSTMESYDSAIDKVHELTSGTEEHKQAIIKANEEAMKLLNTYKDLEYTVGDDGLIIIDEKSLEEAQKAQEELLAKSQRTSLIANQNAENKQLAADKTQFARDNLNSDDDWGARIKNAGAAGVGAAGGGALIGGGVTSWSGPGAAIGAAVGAVLGLIGGFVATIATGSKGADEEDTLDKLAEYYEEHNGAGFETKEALENVLRNELKIEDERLIQSLIDNKDATLGLVKEMSANNKKNDAMDKQAVSDKYGEDIHKKIKGVTKDREDEITDVTTTLMGEELGTLTDKKYEDDYKDAFGNKTDATIQKEYAKAMGWDANLVKNENGNKATYIDNQGNEVKLSDDVARRYLAEQAALKDLGDEVDDYASKAKELLAKEKALSNAADGSIASYEKYREQMLATGKELGLTEEQINKVIKAHGSMNDVAKKQDLSKAFQNWKGADGKALYGEDTANNIAEYLTKDMTEDQITVAINVATNTQNLEQFRMELEQALSDDFIVNVKASSEKADAIVSSGKVTQADEKALKEDQNWLDFLESSGRTEVEFSKKTQSEKVAIVSEYYATLKGLEMQGLEHSKAVYSEDLAEYEAILLYKQAEAQKDKETMANLEQSYKDIDFGAYATMDISDIEDKMDEVQNRIDEIDGQQITLDMEWESTETIEKQMKNVSELARGMKSEAQKVGNQYQLTAAQAKDWMQVYPDLFKQATVTSDGLISLNGDVVDDYIAGQEASVDAAIDANIQQLESRISQLEAEKEASLAELELAQAMAKGKMDLEGATKEYLQETRDALTQYYIDCGMDEVSANKAALDTMGLNEKTYSDMVAKASSRNAENQAESAEQGATAQSSVLGKLWEKFKKFFSNVGKGFATIVEVIAGKKTWADVWDAFTGGPITTDVDTSKITGYDEDGNFLGGDAAKTARTATMKEVGQKRVEEITARISGIDDRINSIRSEILYNEALKEQGLDDYGSTDPSSVDNGKGKEQNKKDKEKEGKEKEGKEKEIEDLEKILERYHEINREIALMERELKKLSKASDQAYGPKKIAAMQAEIDHMTNMADKYNELYAAQLVYLEADKQTLYDNFTGVNIDDDTGELLNYTQLSEQAYNEYKAAEATYNASAQEEADKKALQSAKDLYDKKISYLDQYEDTLDATYDAEEKVWDMLDQIAEKQYQKIMYEVEFKVKLRDRDLKIIDSKIRQMQDNFYQTSEIMGLMKGKLDFYGEGYGPLDEMVKAADDLEAKYAAGAITQDKFVEGMGNLQDQALADIETLYGLNDAMKDYYSNTLNDAISQIKNLTQHYDNLTGKMQHYQNILNLLGHEQNYELQNSLLQGQIDVLNNQIASSEATMDMLKTQLKENQARYDAATTEEQRQFWKERMLETNQALADEESAYLGYLESVGEAANQILSNSISKAFKDAEMAMTNDLGFDAILADMDRMNTLTDEFLTNTNKMYETNKMISSAQLAIDKTQNAQAKQKYQDYIKYIEQLQVSGNLTKTELQTAQARYKVLEAEIALEEAKNSKSEVRLTRDSEGNFGYVYTANQDDVAGATQNYLDAQNELYNIGLENTKAYREKTVQLQQQTLQELQQLEMDFRVNHIISEEQYNQQKAAILETSNALLETYNEQFNLAQFTMATTSYNALMQEDTNFYNGQLSRNREHTSLMEANDTEYYNGIKTTAETTQQTLEENLNKFNAGVLSKEDAQYLARTEKDIKYYTSLRDLADGKAKEIDGIFNTNKDSLANKLKNDFYGHLDTALASCQTSTTNWKNQMAPLVNEVGVSFDGKNVGLSTKIANTKTESEKLNNYLTGDKGLIKGLGEELTAVSNATLEWQTHWEKIQTVIQAYDDLIDRTQTLIRAEAGEIISNPSTPGGGSDSGGSGSGSDSGGSGSGGGNTGNSGVEAQASALASQAMEIVQKVHKGTIKQDSSGWKNNAKAAGYSDDAITLANRAFNDSKEGGGYSYYYDKALQLVQSYDTGGYTGDWGPEGKLALLHQKELVLNAQDTENLLAATTILREISQMLDANALIASLGAINLNAMTVSSPADQVLQQEVTIHADFPNVTDHSEIEMAIDNLINAASQYANRK